MISTRTFSLVVGTALWLVGAALWLVGAAAPVGAKTLPWTGTLTLDLGRMELSVATGGGVATLDNSSGNRLNTLRLAGGISIASAVPVTDPEVSATMATLTVLNATLGTGTFGNLFPGTMVSPGALPVFGVSRVCLVVGCPALRALNLSAISGPSGFGVGGLLTAGGAGPIRISVLAAPWQLGPATRMTQTFNGATATVTSTGFVHGPASNTSSAAQTDGVIQLISPMQVFTKGVPGSSDKLALFSTLTVRFVPEPGMLLLLGSGVVALTLLGRSHFKR